VLTGEERETACALTAVEREKRACALTAEERERACVFVC
jgi:hypothetical protein